MTEADPKDPLGLLVLVPEGLLAFGLGDTKIPPGGIEFLRAFTPELAATACSETFTHEIRAIVVEGHTDSVGKDESNLPISQARSMALVQESLRVLHSPAAPGAISPDLRTGFLTRLAVSGRRSSKLILDTAGKESRARSPRVVLKIRLRSLERRQVDPLLTSAR